MCSSYTRPDRPRVLCVDPRLLECGLGASAGSRAGRLAWLRFRRWYTAPACRARRRSRQRGGALGSAVPTHRCRVYRFAGRPFRRRNGEAVDRLPAEPSITLREAVEPVTAACRAVVFPELEGLIVVHPQYGRHPRMAGEGLSLGWQPNREQAGTRERAASGQRARRVRHIGHV